MNEQTDKLLVKAGAYFGGEGVDYSNFDPKKFAELIVRECLVVINQSNGVGDDDVIKISQDVKKHFGVEE
jgi:hypothetical protein